jgi:hypothetical protein
MTPTVAEVVAEIQSLLGDEPKRVFPDTLALKGFNRAYERLQHELIKDQVPRIVAVTTYTLPAGTTSFTPADAGISNFGELIAMHERQPGTSDEWVELVEYELLNGRQADALRIFEWRGDAFYFYGSSNSREVRLRYYDSGIPPTTGTVGIDGSMLFLSYYGAAAVGPSKGYDDAEIQRMRVMALGPRMDGSGGFLYDLVAPMVRASQRVQRQPQPYGVESNYSWRRVRPPLYIEAPPATGGMEQVLTISGTIDGANDTFTLSALPQDLDLYKNGLLQYPGTAYTLNGTIVTFLPDYIPQPGDLLRAKATV